MIKFDKIIFLLTAILAIALPGLGYLAVEIKSRAMIIVIALGCTSIFYLFTYPALLRLPKHLSGNIQDNEKGLLSVAAFATTGFLLGLPFAIALGFPLELGVVPALYLCMAFGSTAALIRWKQLGLLK